MSSERRLRRVLAAVSLGLFVVQLDFFALNLALPRMAQDLGASTADLQWVISGYMLALGALMILGGRLGDIFGRRRVLTAGLGVFAAAALVCGLAPGAELLIGFRVAQGVGAACIFPVAIAVLSNAYPERRRGRAIGLAYGAAAAGSALGPFAGGGLTQALSWRWVFLVMVPLAAAAAVLVAASVDESRDEGVPRHLDLPGVATVSLGVAAVTLAIDRAQTWGWIAGRTLGLLAAGLALLAAFAAVERRVRWPLVEPALLRNRPFVLVVGMCTVANVAFAVMVFGATLYLQHARGLSPLLAGVVFLAPSVGSALGGPLAPRLGARLPARAVMAAANGLGGAGLLALALAGGGSWAVYLAAFTAAGIGFGVAWAFASVGTQAVVQPERAGEASGVTMTLLIGGAGLAVACAASALRELGQHGTAPGDAVEVVLAATGALALLSAAAMVRLRRRPAVARASTEPD